MLLLLDGAQPLYLDGVISVLIRETEVIVTVCVRLSFGTHTFNTNKFNMRIYLDKDF